MKNKLLQDMCTPLPPPCFFFLYRGFNKYIVLALIHINSAPAIMQTPKITTLIKTKPYTLNKD